MSKRKKGFGNKGKGFGYNSEDEFIATLRRRVNYIYNRGSAEDQERPDNWDEPIELIEGVNVPYGFNDD